MPTKTNTAKKTTVYIGLAIIIILSGFLFWRYFKSSPVEEAPPAEARDKSLGRTSESSAIPASGRIQLEISQPGGKEILDLLLVLQKIKLDIGFFQDEKFQNLTDFYKEIKISEEEKGNSKPFRKIISE